MLAWILLHYRYYKQATQNLERPQIFYMKKVIILATALFFSVGVFAQDKKMEKMDHKMDMKKDCVMMKDGKMMAMKDGKTMAMAQDMTMTNGSMVMMNGTVKMKDGSSMMLKEGQCMDMDGKMMKMKGKKMKEKM